jgi:hypothetical protein
LCVVYNIDEKSWCSQIIGKRIWCSLRIHVRERYSLT